MLQWHFRNCKVFTIFSSAQCERNKPNLTRVQIASQWGSVSRGTESATQMRILDCPLTAQFHGHLLSNFQIELGPNSTYCEGHIYSPNWNYSILICILFLSSKFLRIGGDLHGEQFDNLFCISDKNKVTFYRKFHSKLLWRSVKMLTKNA